MASEGFVYLVHLDRPIGNPKNRRAQAQHYIGWAADVAAREAVHRNGNGSAMLRWCVSNGVGFAIVRTWVGDRNLERRLKRRHEAPKLCPSCNPHLTNFVEPETMTA